MRAERVRMPRSRQTSGVVNDVDFMRIAIDLAERGVGRTSPNPPVGALLVQDGRVVGRGWHRMAGAPHAEVEALTDAGEAARGSTLYVTLEPCNHTGRTGPCTQAILDAGVRRVVIGTRDPNPNVMGGGASFLGSHAVDVTEGVLEADAEHLIRAFRHHSSTGKPWVIAKLAMSLDGKVATREGQSRWITSPESREHAHGVRARVDAILVGAQTVIDDNPSLTARSGQDIVHEPVRVVLDSLLRVPPSVHVAGPGTVVLTTAKAPADRVARMEATRCRVVVCDAGPDGRVSVGHAVRVLGAMGIQGMIVEGGPTVLGSFFDAGEVHEVHSYIAPIVLGGVGARSAVAGHGAGFLDQAWGFRADVSRCGPDIHISGRIASHPKN